MKKIIFVIKFNILFFSCIHSQLNVDSLKTELKKYGQIKSQPGLFCETKVNYQDKDSLVLFEVNQNSDGEITNDSWGLGIYAYKYDEKKLQVEKRYYDKNGKLKFTDWPPIVIIEYDDNDNIIKRDYYNENNEFVDRFKFKYDKKGREIKFEILNSDQEIVIYETNEYNDIDSSVLKCKFHKYMNITTNAIGDTINYLECLIKKGDKIISEKFVDEKGNLVLVKEMYSEYAFASSKYFYGLKKNLGIYKQINYCQSNKLALINDLTENLPLTKSYDIFIQNSAGKIVPVLNIGLFADGMAKPFFTGSVAPDH